MTLKLAINLIALYSPDMYALCADRIDYQLQTFAGTTNIHLCEYQGKLVWVVNNAAKCEISPRSRGQQHINEKPGSHKLFLLAYPSNQIIERKNTAGNRTRSTCRITFVEPAFEPPQRGYPKHIVIRDPGRVSVFPIVAMTGHHTYFATTMA